MILDSYQIRNVENRLYKESGFKIKLIYSGNHQNAIMYGIDFDNLERIPNKEIYPDTIPSIIRYIKKMKPEWFL